MHTIDEAIKEIESGKPVLVFDHETRENEGDVVCAGEHVTPEIIAFMAREARGLICLSLTTGDADRLGLSPMVSFNNSVHGTNFTVSIDAAKGTSTGISAADRALTINLASSPHSHSHDFVRPGHIFPLRAAPGGVCERAGHTEAAVDLVRMAGLRPAAAICEIMNADGSMARLKDLHRFASVHDMAIISVAQIRQRRLCSEILVNEVASSTIPTGGGPVRVASFRMNYQKDEGIAVIVGKPDKSAAQSLVRIHSECLTGESFGSLKCDCGYQLEKSLEMIQEEGAGVVVYLRQEGRGIGIHNKLKAYALQEKGLDTVDANLALGLPVDDRDYALAAQIFRAIGLPAVRLITNNPMKVRGLEKYGVKVSEVVPITPPLLDENRKYLETKAAKLGHLLNDCFR